VLLYHFASVEYLRQLQRQVHELMAFIDPTLDLAKLQGRDSVLTDARWGTRNTSGNWANNGWPFVADFELSIAKQIAQRSYEAYAITGANQCARGLSELSLDWMTPDEQSKFEGLLEKIMQMAGYIDDTMNQHERASRWDDFGLTMAGVAVPEAFSSAPGLRVRSDVVANTGETPPRTGVYVPVDDPAGAPQFCWVGRPAGALLEVNTLNDLGMEALSDIGRDSLWVDETRMFEFVQKHAKDARLTDDPLFEDSVEDPDLAPSLVARNAFTSRPGRWMYVEQIHGEIETFASHDEKQVTPIGQRVPAGTACPQSGFYFTPAKIGSRRQFEEGEIMPEAGGSYGATIWQWDAQQ
jgi:hypothetical protein